MKVKKTKTKLVLYHFPALPWLRTIILSPDAELGISLDVATGDMTSLNHPVEILFSSSFCCQEQPWGLRVSSNGRQSTGVAGLRVIDIFGTHIAGSKVLPKLGGGGNLEASEGGGNQPSKVSIKLSC